MKKTLLIISNGYPHKNWQVNSTFVKAQIDVIKEHFRKVIVIVQTPYFPKLLNKVKKIPELYKNYSKLSDYKYDNVEVYYARYLSLPEGYFNDFRGESCYKAISKCIKKNNIEFDLIHSHFIWISGYVAVRLKTDFNKKVVVTGHGFDVYDLPFRDVYWYNKIRNILKGVDKIMTVSERNNSCLKQLFFDNSMVLTNGFDSNKFRYMHNKKELKKTLGVDLNKKILLHVGNLVKIKNHTNLLNAVNVLKTKRKDFILYLVGDGVEKQNILNKIKKLQLEKFVKVIGPKPHDEIPLWMNVADLFILPSFKEGNPTVMFECLGCGTPYIGTDVGGVKDVIKNTNYGYIYDDPNNYNTLSELINIGLHKKWNTKQILNYAKKYAWQNIAKKLLKVYNEL